MTASEIPPSPLEAYAQDANPLVNPGTPSAGVEPIMGAASSPGAQTATAVDVSRLEDEPLFSVSDILRQSPGISLKQGNGPRDLGISIRGSNARNGFGIRNIVIFDDGFPVTQPDGLSRSDLIDPHAYIGVDVWRGPSSALFGNYATGGALNFRTWPGGNDAHRHAGGQKLIVHFWSLACAPCLTELPEWGKFLAGHPGAPLVLVNWETCPQPEDRIRNTLAKSGFAGTEQWALADDFEQKIRFAIDRDWMGELPRTQLIAPDGSVTTISGAMDFAKLAAWLDEAKTP